MIFNSIPFLFVFLPLALILYYLTPMVARNYTLLFLSLFFYAWGSPEYFILLVVSILMNYGLVRLMSRVSKPGARSTWLTLILTWNLLWLVLFKYLGFAFQNINGLFGTEVFVESLVQPLGISFFTFQALSYALDVYRQKIPAESNLGKVALYLAMFPQIASGPIVRYEELSHQLKPRLVDLEGMSQGAVRFILGLFKKVFIANSLVGLWQGVKASPDPSALSAWVGLLAFTFYIFYDFSGYMDMAIGLAGLFGFRLPENFKDPYLSRSVSEFWRRWHMTLGRWFRDYIYIPLGGSRQGLGRYLLAVAAVWFTTGLWHGPAWNFILWGLFFGLILVLEKFFLKGVLAKLPAWAAILYTMFLVMMGWVLFDTQSLGQAGAYLAALFGRHGLTDKTGIYALYRHFLVFFLAWLLLFPRVRQSFHNLARRPSPRARLIHLALLAALFLLSVAYLLNQTYSPSMYIGF